MATQWLDHAICMNEEAIARLAKKGEINSRENLRTTEQKHQY